MGTSVPRNWRLTNCPETTKMMLGRPLMTNLKMTVTDDCAVSTCNPPDSVYKSSHPLLVGGRELAFGRMSTSLPPIAGIWNKAKLPFYQPGLLIGFWVASSWTPQAYLLVTDFGAQRGAGYCWLLCFHDTWLFWVFQGKTVAMILY